MPAISRRNLFSTAAGATAFLAAHQLGFAQWDSTHDTSPPFMLPALPYATNALEPIIDVQTMDLHHDKHHGAYVSNLNEVAKTVPQIAQRPMEHVLAHLVDLPEGVRTTVRNNMGGHANHSMYWTIMGPNGGEPDGVLLDAIKRDLGGIEKLQDDFDDAGGRVFGSGWVFVTVTDGRLAIETRANQDTPLMDGKRVLFGNDVWEHAYYLKYARYAAALNGTLGI